MVTLGAGMAKLHVSLRILVGIVALAALVAAVDRANFKKCSESSFCKRQRDLPVRARSRETGKLWVKHVDGTCT